MTEAYMMEAIARMLARADAGKLRMIYQFTLHVLGAA